MTKKNEKVEINCEKSFKEDEKTETPRNINKLPNMIEEMVKNEYSELLDFLEDLNLMKYFERFQKNCIDDLCTILGNFK